MSFERAPTFEQTDGAANAVLQAALGGELHRTFARPNPGSVTDRVGSR